MLATPVGLTYLAPNNPRSASFFSIRARLRRAPANHCVHGLSCVSEPDGPAREGVSVLLLLARGETGACACAACRGRGEVLDRSDRGIARELRSQGQATRRSADIG